MGDSLYRNSIYLMSSTLVMAVLGFAFWMINARLFTVEQIGLATTIISVMGLITGFSVLGLNIGLIRYLPRAKEKNKKINTAFTLVAITTVIVTSIFLIGLGKFSPRLIFIQESLILSFSFIFFMVFAGFNSIIDSVFIAYRNTKYILAKNTIFSCLKIVLSFLFVGLGAYGIFSSWMISLIIAISFSFFMLIKKYEYKPKFAFYDSIIHKIGKYSFGNYVAGFIGGLPLMILPLMITNMIGPETTAYYYMAMMIAGLLFVIPQATTQSLFAEGSYDEENLKVQVKKAVKIIALLMVPGILITVFFGQYILLAFGKEYSTEGFRFLQIIALSGVFVGVNAVFGKILQIKKRVKEIIMINIFGAIVLIGLVYLLMDKGLLGIGLAWVIGRSVVSLIYIVFVRVRKKKNKD